MKQWLREWLGIDDTESIVIPNAFMEIDALSKRLTSAEDIISELQTREQAKGYLIESLEREVAALKLAAARSEKRGPIVTRNMASFKAMLEAERAPVDANR